MDRIGGLHVILFLMIGCSGAESDGPAIADLASPRPWATGPIIETGRLASSGDDSRLSWVRDADIDSKGNVYVADFATRAVIVTNPDLSLQRTIGQEGEGPGEFRSVSSVQLLDADSVLVYDGQLNRVTVFIPGGNEVAYIHHPRQPGIRVREVFKVPGDTGLIARYSPAHSASSEGGEKETRDYLVHLGEVDGSLAHPDPLLRFASDNVLIGRHGDRQGGAISVAKHPYGHTSFVQVLGRGGLVYASSLDLRVDIVRPNGELENALSHKTRPIRVDEATLKQAIKRLPKKTARALRSQAPHTWPPVAGLIVDEQGHIWVGIRHGDLETLEWAVFTEDGLHLGSVSLPSDFSLLAIRDGRLVGVAQGRQLSPRLDSYQVSYPPGWPQPSIDHLEPLRDRS